LTKVWPPNIAVGSGDTTITLYGRHLFSTSSVHVGTADIVPTAIGSGFDTLLVLVPATELKATGTLNITVTNAPTPASNVLPWPVTAPGPRIWSVVNGASYDQPATGAAPVIAPGEIITILGTSLGPALDPTTGLGGLQATPPSPGGAYSTRLGTAGGTPPEAYVEFETSTGPSVWTEAPLLYADEGQMNAIVPFGMPIGTGQRMRVTYASVTSAPFTVDVVAADPGIFTANSSGMGPAAVINWSTSGGILNSDKNPVVRGNAIEIYATGGGTTSPAVTAEGELVSVNPALLPHLDLEGTTTVTIGGVTVAAEFAGSVPGSVAGLVQINVTVPNTVKAGKAVPILVTINGRTSPSGPTIAVK